MVDLTIQELVDGGLGGLGTNLVLKRDARLLFLEAWIFELLVKALEVGQLLVQLRLGMHGHLARTLGEDGYGLIHVAGLRCELIDVYGLDGHGPEIVWLACPTFGGSILACHDNQAVSTIAETSQPIGNPSPARQRRFGTSSLVVAAFVGPGTVLTCASAGVRFDYALAWVLLFSAIAVFVLQSFTAASGILAGQGLGEALRGLAKSRVSRAVVFTLVVLGLWIGCAAFETGNLLGAAAGLDVAFGLGRTAPLLIASGLAVLLLLLDLKAITRVLAGLVTIMGVLFVSSAVLAGVDMAALFGGLMVPRIPDGSILTVVALMGTTVVTYNLFLHASASKNYWSGTDSAEAWRGELLGMAVFIPLGGIVSMAILATGATMTSAAAPDSIAGFAVLLEPSAGPAARHLFAAGLLAAGLTSAVTAPLAAAAGITELFGWTREQYPNRFRGIWLSVVISGLFFGLTEISPLQLIVAAQAANGVLLPLIAGTVVVVAWRQSESTLPRWYLGLGGLIVLVCAGLGFRTLSWVAGQLGL